MGGYGAYNIARLDPDRFCAVGGHSPAIWETAGETADGAFDDGEDFERNDVIEIAGASDPGPFAGLRLWLDAGDDDPFLAGDEALEQALREGGARPVVKRSPGGHDSGYWNGNWDEYFRFYAHALERLHRRRRAAGRGAGEGREAGQGDEPRGDQPGGEGTSGSSSRRSREASPSAG